MWYAIVLPNIQSVDYSLETRGCYTDICPYATPNYPGYITALKIYYPGYVCDGYPWICMLTWICITLNKCVYVLPWSYYSTIDVSHSVILHNTCDIPGLCYPGYKKYPWKRVVRRRWLPSINQLVKLFGEYWNYGRY